MSESRLYKEQRVYFCIPIYKLEHDKYGEVSCSGVRMHDDTKVKLPHAAQNVEFYTMRRKFAHRTLLLKMFHKKPKGN